jgi:putative ABC transport system ATP-binding protein
VIEPGSSPAPGPAGPPPFSPQPFLIPPPIAASPLPVPVIDIRAASRIYQMGDLEVPALVEATFRVDVGEFVAVVGPSGSGKTTLMNLIGCLDRPTSGVVSLAGTSVADLDDDALAAVRSRFVGFVFQAYNLLPRTSALENVAAPLLYQGVGRRERMDRARATLERLGLGDRLAHQPTELSGGQQQRVAIARALVTDPPLILADEPTGNLDSHAGAEVMGILRGLHDAGRTIVLITHDPGVAAVAPRQVHIRDGRLYQ